MRNKLFRQFMAFFATIVLVLSTSVCSFAAIGDDPDKPTPAGNPEMTLVNGPVYDVSAGTSTEVELRLKNISSSSANSIIITPSFTAGESMPFSFDFKDNGNRINQLSPKAEKTVTVILNVDKTAPSKTYSVTLNFVSYNNDNVKSTNSSTAYFKVKNTTSQPNFSFENIKTTPAIINGGQSGAIGATIRNNGTIDMYDVNVSLKGLSNDTITASGVSNQKIGNIGIGTQKNFSFKIMSNSGISGNFPLSFEMKYKDVNGTEYTFVQEYYVNIGGAAAGQKPYIEITDMKEPSGTFGVNNNFAVKFNLINKGENTAKNVKITANPSAGDGAVVPKSSSIQTLKELKAGQSAGFEFTFAATAVAKSQNYPIEFTVEYEDGTKTQGVNNLVTFKQYAGVNVNNPTGGTDGKTSKPKIIISKYTSNPLIVMAGENFDLNMTFLNTHQQKMVKNIKMFLTLSEEKSTDTAKTGNIFTPVDSSNTFYFDSIPAKGTVQKMLKLYVVPDAQPKTYTLTVNFEYEDEAGNEYTATELLGINVKQPTQIETGQIALPPTTEANMPLSVSFDLFNTGKVTLSNLMVKVEGDIEAQTKSTYFGNFESGSSEYYDSTFSFPTVGKQNVSIIVSYDDPSGEHIEKKQDFMVDVTEPVPMDPSMDPNGTMGGAMTDKPAGTGKLKVVAGVAVVAVVVIVVALGLRKKSNAKKEAAFLEADDEKMTDNNMDEKQKGKDANEQL